MDKKTDKEDWLNVLQHKLIDYEQPVENDAWQQLQSRLQAANGHRTMVRRRFNYSIAAAIAVLIGVSTFFALLRPTVSLQQDKSNNGIASVAPSVQTNTPANSKIDANITAQVKTTSSLRRTNVSSAVPIAVSSISEVSSNTDIPQEVAVGETAKTTSKEVAQSPSQTKKEERAKAGKKRRYMAAATTPQSAAAYTQRHKSAGWSVGLAVGGGAISNSSNNLNNSSAMSTSSGPILLNEQYIYTKSAEKSYSSHSFKHNQPISLGVNFRKGINKQFSAETGLVFTMLTSDVDDGNRKQRLYYIGIPIRGNWSFLQKKQVELYLTGGGMVEKCVYARLSGEKIKLNELQLSVNGGVGIAYKLAPHLSVYGETGVIYFFDDGSFVQSIRKDKPFNINLQAGFRLSY